MSKIVKDENGGTRYYNDADEYHRIEAPAIEWADGSKAWLINGEYHRIEAPAIEWADGAREYWINGMLHREDGPAIENVDGYKEYWINDEYLTEEEFNQQIKGNK